MKCRHSKNYKKQKNSLARTRDGMDGMRMRRRILEWKPMGMRIRVRPRKRWIEDFEEDIQTMGIRGWRKLSKERTEWKKITEKAKTHSGL